MAIFFVGGSQRSGTTLLQTVLCQDPEVNPLIQEAKYLRHLLSGYQFGRQMFDRETKDYFVDLDQYRNFNSRIVRSFLKNTLSIYKPARHLVLREPHLTMLFPELAELLPRAKFVCVVRDPRDVIASMVRVGQKLGTHAASDAMGRLFQARDMTALSRHVMSFYRPVIKNAADGLRGRLLFLRYEDLVAEPGAAVQKLRGFTGIALGTYDAATEPDTGRVNYRQLDEYRSAWSTEQYTGKVTDSRIGAHAEVLDEAECLEIAKQCAGFMHRFGYG